MSKKEIKFFDDNGKKFFLLVSIIVLSCSIIYGRDITIGGDVGADVAGNGSGVNGTGPFNPYPNNNKIRILGIASVTGSVFGARNEGRGSLDVTNNKAIIDTTGNIERVVYGGWSLGTATSNKVEISNGNIRGDVFGGWSQNGEAKENVVEIKGGNIGKDVYGGWSENREATGNVVEINGGNIEGSVFGAYSDK
jgi:hypothetical protein